MKLKKLVARLMALGLCSFATYTPALASPNIRGRLSPLKQLRPCEPNFPSLDVNILGQVLKLF